ncbi:MAG TPA: hypothetical protein VG650_04095 [Mycobacteriales bacterium]|nr:hypothetical protein [Mycobacteriales bacterium]
MRAARACAAALAATALLSACGPSSHLDLRLRTVGVTVPRVLAPAITLVPPSAPPPAPLPPVPPVASQLPPAPTLPTPPAVQTCPKASPLAVPKFPAGVTVTPPAAQTFVQTAHYRLTDGKLSAAPVTSVKVTIKNLPDTKTVTGQQVKSWQVQQVDTAAKSRAVEVYQLVMPSGAVDATTPGVYLVGLAWSDPIRGKLTFQPLGNGLEVLPSPVEVAENPAQYAGIATDPNTLTTLELIRNVGARKRIDLCGQVVDTWTVKMTGTLTSPKGVLQVTWDQQFATAYGAADVDELFSVTDVTGGGTWSRRLVSTTVPKPPTKQAAK